MLLPNFGSSWLKQKQRRTTSEIVFSLLSAEQHMNMKVPMSPLTLLHSHHDHRI
jgi:hypothetical protein